MQFDGLKAADGSLDATNIIVDSGDVFPENAVTGQLFLHDTAGLCVHKQDSNWSSVGVQGEPTPESVVISLLGTNGLTTSSYAASSLINAQLSIAGAFDGFGWLDNLPPIEGAVQPATGQAYGSSGNTNEWLSIDFGQQRVVTAIDFYSIQTQYETYLPKDVQIQYSNDGTDWSTHESFVVPLSSYSSTLLSEPTPSARYFRIFMLDGHGQSSIQLDNVVLKGY